MKRKFKIMNHQIEQLKEEISSKDLALVKEHFDHMKVEKEKESLRFELNKARQQIKEAESAITAQKAEIEKLNHIINEADLERARQKKEFDLVVNERDILGTQLIRRRGGSGVDSCWHSMPLVPRAGLARSSAPVAMQCLCAMGSASVQQGARGLRAASPASFASQPLPAGC